MRSRATNRADRGPGRRLLGHGAGRAARAPRRIATTLWGRDAGADRARSTRTRENPRYLPGMPLPESLRATTDLAPARARAPTWCWSSRRSHAFAETLRALAPHAPRRRRRRVGDQGLRARLAAASCTKSPPNVLGADVPLAVVTGPSFAKEVAQGLPTAVTVHSRRRGLRRSRSPTRCTARRSAPTPATTCSAPNSAAR